MIRVLARAIRTGQSDGGRMNANSERAVPPDFDDTSR